MSDTLVVVTSIEEPHHAGKAARSERALSLHVASRVACGSGGAEVKESPLYKEA